MSDKYCILWSAKDDFEESIPDWYSDRHNFSRSDIQEIAGLEDAERIAEDYKLNLSIGLELDNWYRVFSISGPDLKPTSFYVNINDLEHGTAKLMHEYDFYSYASRYIAADVDFDYCKGSHTEYRPYGETGAYERIYDWESGTVDLSVPLDEIDVSSPIPVAEYGIHISNYLSVDYENNTCTAVPKDAMREQNYYRTDLDDYHSLIKESLRIALDSGCLGSEGDKIALNLVSRLNMEQQCINHETPYEMLSPDDYELAAEEAALEEELNPF